ncbi:hypothetical protein PBY51_024847 [Eleginops maclovinus]|nr:hypothetical protein PBY51_024847 [Eleginops maclovinus]
MKWQTEYSVSGLGWVSSFSVVNTFAPFAQLCGPPCIGQDGGSPSEQELASPRVPKPLDFTTHGTCEHDTGARRKTACRTNSVTARAI